MKFNLVLMLLFLIILFLLISKCLKLPASKPIVWKGLFKSGTGEGGYGQKLPNTGNLFK